MTPLTGPRLTLRPVEPADLDSLYIWENDSSAWGVASTRAPLSRRQLHDYIESYDADIYAARQLRLVIEETASRRAIGAIDLYDFDPRDLRAFAAIYIAEDSRRQGYGSEALGLMADYGRAVIGLHQIAALRRRRQCRVTRPLPTLRLQQRRTSALVDQIRQPLPRRHHHAAPLRLTPPPTTAPSAKKHTAPHVDCMQGCAI